MNELQQLGPRLRSLRQERGWTLDDLASRAGMSVSTLSRLESGKRQASLELLLPLTKQLGIRVDDLLAPQQRDPRVHSHPVTRGGLTIAPLTRESSDVRAFKITYRPDAPTREAQVHSGSEWLYVLTGKIQLELGEQLLTLSPGEAAEFDTMTPHRIRASGPGTAEVISIFNGAGERVHLHSHQGEGESAGESAGAGGAAGPGSGPAGRGDREAAGPAPVASEHG